jgi:hypothetical protein
MSGSDVDADCTKIDTLSLTSNGSSIAKKRKKDRKPIITMENADPARHPQTSDMHE